MRIVAEQNWKNYKCTVFHYNHKYSLKVNMGFQDVQIVIPDIEGLETPEEILKLCDEQFYTAFQKIQQELVSALTESVRRNISL